MLFTTARAFIPATLAIACFAGSALAQTEMKGKIDAVTVYRGQALVTRVIDVGGGGGLKEIVVTDLPPAIAPESLYAEADTGVEVRSVRYRQRAIAQDAREDVRKLEQEVRTLADQLETSRSKAKQVDWQRAYLDKVENFVSGTAVVENNKGVLNADTLTKMTEHLVTQRQKLTDDTRKLQLEARDLEEQLNLKQRDLAQLNARGNRTAREATIFVNTPQGGGKLRVSYIVNSATWTPSYNLRASVGGGDVGIEYQASVQQVSGEDWTDVKMTLSTATPALVAAGPQLQAMTLALAGPQVQSAAIDELKTLGYKQAKEQSQTRRDELNRARQSNSAFASLAGNQPAPSGGGGGQGGWADRGGAEFFSGNLREADKAINDNASREQLLDFLSSEVVTRNKDDRKPTAPSLSTEGVSVAYTLASRTSLPSRDDQQLIQISRGTSKADFYRVATPVLSTFVYNEANVTNTGEQLLLAGPSSSYSGGEFVGRGVVPTTAVGQSFIAGFGNDSSLRTSRELVDRVERTQGGNRVVEFTYRLTVDNFGKAPAKVRLMDRMPTTKGNDIRVELLPKQGGTTLSSDPVYNADQKPRGILRWDVEVPAGTSVDKPFAVEYTFRVEYDRQMSITEVPGK
jgi:hypothetical protein